MLHGNRFSLSNTRSDGVKIWNCFLKSCSVQLSTRGTKLILYEKQNYHNHTSFVHRQMRRSGLPVQSLDADKNPKSKIWYSTDELKFYVTKDGARSVRFRNYDYYCYDRGGKIVCVCFVRKCTATALLDDQCHIKFNVRRHSHSNKRKESAEENPNFLPFLPSVGEQNVVPVPEEKEVMQIKDEPVDLDLI
ncbi:uncharacterized protein LOC128093737 isoform X2 [Culex pipiens pallens]|nr:uncharacterized protein LOC128093737 isoform X2 [Culex pipiens pallens]